MNEQVKKSVLPIYLVGFVWLGYAALFPLYRVTDYIICTLLSVLVHLVGKMIFPDRAYQAPREEKEQPKQEQKPKSTGNPEIDALMKERDRAVSEMRRLNENISDRVISDQIDHLEMVTHKIIAQVVEKPEKLPQIRRFMDYYLPTTLKLLNTYDRMGAVGVTGSNITTTREKIEDMMDVITKAFDKQLDTLFTQDAMDIATDITVMENLLKQEGFGESGMIQ